MGKRYRITLEAEERQSLEQLLAKGKADVRRLKHAQILLNSDEANGNRAWRVPRIAEALGGHVDFLADSVAPEVMALMVAVNDGEAIPQ